MQALTAAIPYIKKSPDIPEPTNGGNYYLKKKLLWKQEAAAWALWDLLFICKFMCLNYVTTMSIRHNGSHPCLGFEAFNFRS